METNHSDKPDKPNNAESPQMEMGGSTSSKPKINDDCPILTLPDDILAKIIAYIPVAQWASLELLCDFRPAVLIAWRQLRNINVERELLIKADSVESILQKLADCSPFLTSVSGIDFHLHDEDLHTETVELLAQFEHLQSITVGAAKENTRGVPLENVVVFLESTRSRASLKEIRFLNVAQRRGDRATILDRFVSSLVNGHEIQSPLKLEKFTMSWVGDPLFIRLDTLDTTRLTDIRVGKTRVEPQQLIDLIERAPNLFRIELSFLYCPGECGGPRLQANKKLLTALASLQNLTAIKFDNIGKRSDCVCTDFGHEFIQMLKAIGQRGQLRKLAMACYFARLFFDMDNPDMDEMDPVCLAIRDYIPYLQSIKTHIDYITNGRVLDIVGLAELEEIHLTQFIQLPSSTSKVENTIRKMAQLPHLKRLALGMFFGADVVDSFKYLADAKALTDLRIGYGELISTSIFEKWSDGFASNLEILMVKGIFEGNDDDEKGLIRLLEKSVRLRVLILDGLVTDRSLMAITESCMELEILGVRSSSNGITVQQLQQIVDRCPKLKRLGGFNDEIRNQLQFQKYRKIGDVDMEFGKYDFDDDEYN